MRQKDIYIGTLKQCNDIYNYKKFGEERYCPDFTIGGLRKSNRIEMGTLVRYVDNLGSTILIKVSKHRYIKLTEKTEEMDLVLANLGVSKEVINDFPIKNNDVYVDADTLVPYFNEEENKNKKVKVKTLKYNLMGNCN